MINPSAAENARLRKETLRKRARLNDVFREVFSTDAGKECLQEIMRMSGAFERNTLSPVEHTFILEGQRRLAIGIADYVFGKNKAAQVLRMLEESKNETV